MVRDPEPEIFKLRHRQFENIDFTSFDSVESEAFARVLDSYLTALKGTMQSSDVI